MSEETEPDVEVSDGKIEWEPGNIVDIDPNELEVFEKNEEIYGDTEDVEQKFVESVREKGVLEPLVVDEDKTIISGHRRWSAALEVGAEKVPVRVSSFEDEIEKREALIEFNRQRDKTPAQVVNEFEEQVEIEKEKAKERVEEAGSVGGSKGKQTFTDPSEGQARDKAAEKINADVTSVTLEKGQKVKEIAEGETDKEEEVVEVAKQKWEELEEGEETFHGALKEVNKTEDKVQYEKEVKEKSSNFDSSLQSGDAVSVVHGDFYEELDEYKDESFDHIITDPPYDEEALELWEKLAEQAERVLKPGGLLIAYSGQTYLPQVYSILDEKLDYVWQLTITHDNPHMHPHHNVKIGYKPIIVFGKDVSQYSNNVISDLIDVGEMEKSDHEWQQSVLEVDKIISAMTDKNDLILDPMCGSGTTGVSSIKNKRRCVLMDVDESSVEKTKGRISEVI